MTYILPHLPPFITGRRGEMCHTTSGTPTSHFLTPLRDIMDLKTKRYTITEIPHLILALEKETVLKPDNLFEESYLREPAAKYASIPSLPHSNLLKWEWRERETPTHAPASRKNAIRKGLEEEPELLQQGATSYQPQAASIHNHVQGGVPSRYANLLTSVLTLQDKLDLGSVHMIYNPTQIKDFTAYRKKMQKRASIPSKPWKSDPDAPIREEMMKKFQENVEGSAFCPSPILIY